MLTHGYCATLLILGKMYTKLDAVEKVNVAVHQKQLESSYQACMTSQ